MHSNSKRPSGNFLRLLLAYLDRWQLTNIPYLIKNVISTALVFALTCYAVQENAFELMEASKSCLFAVLMCTIWSGLFNSIAMFYSEADYMMDDLTKVLPVRVYIIANVLIQALLCLIEALICTTIFYTAFSYGTEGLVTPNMNLDYGITFFLILFSADMLGFAVGVLVKNITTAMTIIPLVLIVQFLFSGCLFELDGVLSTVSKCTSAKWGYSALGSLADLNNMPSRFAEIVPGYQPEPSELFDAAQSFITGCWVSLLVLAVAAIAAAAILLFFKINQTD